MTLSEAIENYKKRLNLNMEDSIRLRAEGQTQLAFERYQENLLLEEFITTLNEIKHSQEQDKKEP